MKSKPFRSLILITLVSILASWSTLARAADDDVKASFDALKKLDGQWESAQPGPDGKPMAITFHVTANGSVVMETMMPGTEHEMMNAYHLDGDKLIMTHYCAQGVQPRMKLESAADKTLKFGFLDCTNLKQGEGCMGGLEITADGDKLVEKWATRDADGKMADHVVFELHRKA